MFTTKEILKATNGVLIQGEGRDFSFSGISTDTRTTKKGELFIAIRGNNFNGHNFVKAAQKRGCRGAVVSEKLKNSFPADFVIIRVKDTTVALGRIANFHRKRFNIPVVAITGSNGKTTTKDMLSFILRKKYRVLSSIGTHNNQIGVPQTLLKLKPSHGIAVLELGTNHFGEIDYLAKICQPSVAIITNIGPSHLEYFKNLDNVFKEKIVLLKNLKAGGLAIINADDNYLKKISNKRPNCKIIDFGIHAKIDFQASKISFANGGLKFVINNKFPAELKTLAIHNIYNCLAAIACCKYLQMDYNCIKKQLRKFRFPPGRLEVKNFKNITVIDDTYNANPASFKNAIDVLSNFDPLRRKVLIGADMLELGAKAEEFHSSTGKCAAESGIDILISIGRLAKFYSLAARKAGMVENAVSHFSSVPEALKKIKNFIKLRDVILVKGSRAMHLEKIVESLQRPGVQ